METIGSLIRKLRSSEPKLVRQAIEELRVRGWLEDGSLKGISLCHAHLFGADLFKADLTHVDLHQADLSYADLCLSNLHGAKFGRSQMLFVNLSKADLTGADLFKVNMLGSRNVLPEQLRSAKRLYGAILPHGGIYDGRYQLSGDLEFARWGRIDIHDNEAMAEFYGVSLIAYLRGQEESHLV